MDRAYHHVNVRVLRKAPCTVAILVDRALGGMAQVSAPDVSYTVSTVLASGTQQAATTTTPSSLPSGQHRPGGPTRSSLGRRGLTEAQPARLLKEASDSASSSRGSRTNRRLLPSFPNPSSSTFPLSSTAPYNRIVSSYYFGELQLDRILLPYHLVSETPVTTPLRSALAHLIETRGLRQARGARAPGVSAFLSRFETKIEAAIDGLTKAQQTTTTKIDDLLSWRPDLERRVADLSDAVAALQAAPTPPLAELVDQRTTTPQPSGDHIGTSAGAADNNQGPHGHGVTVNPRGSSAVPHLVPPPPPASGQYDSLIPSSVMLSPFAHASQLLSGLGQAHPSITFPQFSGENPNLWKTLCEQYFQMFGILPSFWVPMAALNFSGSTIVWMQSIQKRLAEFDWDMFTSLLCTRFGPINPNPTQRGNSTAGP